MGDAVGGTRVKFFHDLLGEKFLGDLFVKAEEFQSTIVQRGGTIVNVETETHGGVGGIYIIKVSYQLPIPSK